MRRKSDIERNCSGSSGGCYRRPLISPERAEKGGSTRVRLKITLGENESLSPGVSRRFSEASAAFAREFFVVHCSVKCEISLLKK